MNHFPTQPPFTTIMCREVSIHLSNISIVALLRIWLFSYLTTLHCKCNATSEMHWASHWLLYYHITVNIWRISSQWIAIHLRGATVATGQLTLPPVDWWLEDLDFHGTWRDMSLYTGHVTWVLSMTIHIRKGRWTWIRIIEIIQLKYFDVDERELDLIIRGIHIEVRLLFVFVVGQRYGLFDRFCSYDGIGCNCGIDNVTVSL